MKIQNQEISLDEILTFRSTLTSTLKDFQTSMQYELFITLKSGEVKKFESHKKEEWKVLTNQEMIILEHLEKNPPRGS